MSEETWTEETWDFSTGRVWTYSKHTWNPRRWWHKVGVPQFGGTDEWGRQTVVWGLWFIGYLVWAYRTCWCEDCHYGREQTYWFKRLEEVDR